MRTALPWATTICLRTQACASRYAAADGTPTAHGLQFQPRLRGDAGAPAGLQFRPHSQAPYAFHSHLLASGPEAPASLSPGGEDGDEGGWAHDGGTKVSHGALEKQRRDRINSMIDLLRVIGAHHA